MFIIQSGKQLIHHPLRLLLCISSLGLFAHSPQVLSDDVIQPGWECESFIMPDNFGPFDYTDPRNRVDLEGVEYHHFTQEVVSLVRGKTSVGPLGDIHYTVWRFPNHHRALDAIARYWLREKNPPPAGKRESPECWFSRALKFKSDDHVVRIIYGNYRYRRGEYQKALVQYNKAMALRPDSPELHYNLGLLKIQMKDFKAAREHAEKAYGQGYPLPGLKAKLKKLGHW